jgi:hypothetical protein
MENGPVKEAIELVHHPGKLTYNCHVVGGGIVSGVTC